MIFLAIGIPWYWPLNETTLILGFPIWVAVAIGVSILASAYTAYLLSTPWTDDDKDGAD